MSFFLLVIITLLSLFWVSGGNCGPSNCLPTFDNKLNVHLVPHSHDDVGWLKTLDQYYYGSHKEITPVGVSDILDSVMEALAICPQRKFIYVEMAFFTKWWYKQSETKRNKVKGFVASGQLEFINGGWSMNDEASSNYIAIIDQMTLGLQFLNETFGECGRPSVAWQIDPFGHSKEQANLFAQMGFEGLFFGRLDYQDKDRRLLESEMEMIWMGRKDSSLFTGILYNNYEPPPGFCWDAYCSDDPLIDDPNSSEYNLKFKIAAFLFFVRKQRSHYTTNHVLLTMGSDFHYTNAHLWYKNMDKLISHINAEESHNVHLLYSTPSCYLSSIKNTSLSWPLKHDDFFPYASDSHSYWTGYYTSRPSLKGLITKSLSLLSICKQIEVLSDKGEESRIRVRVLQEALAVAQHHDAVTGTAKQAVTNDYVTLLVAGRESCLDSISNSFDLPQSFCSHLNISECSFSETFEDFIVNVYNPLSRRAKRLIVRFPVKFSENDWMIKDDLGIVIPSQILPIASSVINISERYSQAKFELVFFALDVSPMSRKSYHVSYGHKRNPLHFNSKASKKQEGEIGYKSFKLILNDKGSLQSLILKKGENQFNLTQVYGAYTGFIGNNLEAGNRSSGAYIFRPITQEPHLFSMTPNITIFKGPLVHEIHYVYNSWLSQVLRIYNEVHYSEFEWLVGPIPRGSEIISRFTLQDFKSNGVFYTDSNGRQLLKRKLNRRPTWNYSSVEPVSGNYYPLTSQIVIKNEKGARMSLVTDRSQGGTSLHDGEIEVMIHRRLWSDDAFGVDEPLNEENTFGQGIQVRGKHWLLFETNPKSTNARFLSQKQLWDPLLSFQLFPSKSNNEFFRLSDLPPNIQVLTLEKQSSGKILLRLEHFFDENEHSLFSKPVTIDLRKIFLNGITVSIQEVALGGNVFVENDDRLPKNLSSGTKKSNLMSTNGTVVFKPMDIKSFLIELRKP